MIPAGTARPSTSGVRGERRTDHFQMGRPPVQCVVSIAKIKHAPISHPSPEEIKLILKRLNPSASPLQPLTPMLPAQRTDLNTHTRHTNGRHAFASMNTTKTIERGRGAHHSMYSRFRVPSCERLVIPSPQMAPHRLAASYTLLPQMQALLPN
jgi:hypothetical protein